MIHALKLGRWNSQKVVLGKMKLWNDRNKINGANESAEVYKPVHIVVSWGMLSSKFITAWLIDNNSKGIVYKL